MTVAVDVKMDGCVLDKNCFLIKVLVFFFFKIRLGLLPQSPLLKLPRRNWSLIRSMEYLSSEIAFCLCKSAIWPCIEYVYHVQAVAPGCYLDILNTQQKRLCRNVGPTLAA